MRQSLQLILPHLWLWLWLLLLLLLWWLLRPQWHTGRLMLLLLALHLLLFGVFKLKRRRLGNFLELLWILLNLLMWLLLLIHNLRLLLRGLYLLLLQVLLLLEWLRLLLWGLHVVHHLRDHLSLLLLLWLRGQELLLLQVC